MRIILAQVAQVPLEWPLRNLIYRTSVCRPSCIAFFRLVLPLVINAVVPIPFSFLRRNRHPPTMYSHAQMMQGPGMIQALATLPPLRGPLS